METLPQSDLPGVALYIDWDNIAIPLNRDLGLMPSGKAVIKFARHYGRVLIARAYANWSNVNNAPSCEAVYREGITPVFAPSRIKNSADVLLAVECCQQALNSSLIQTVVIVSGDGYVLHLIGEARRFGKRIVVLALDKAIHHLVSYLADEFVPYETLLTGYVQQAAGVLRVSRRREQRNEIDHAFRVLKEVVQVIRAKSDEGFPEHDALACKQGMLSRIPDFQEEKLGFERFRHFLFSAELAGLIRVDTRAEHPVIYKGDETVSDDRKLLMAPAQWKAIAEFLTPQKTKDEAIKAFGNVVLSAAIDSHFVRQRFEYCLLNPWDERAAVYRSSSLREAKPKAERTAKRH